jgi:hypothetical protein
MPTTKLQAGEIRKFPQKPNVGNKVKVYTTIKTPDHATTKKYLTFFGIVTGVVEIDSIQKVLLKKSDIGFDFTECDLFLQNNRVIFTK